MITDNDPVVEPVVEPNVPVANVEPDLGAFEIIEDTPAQSPEDLAAIVAKLQADNEALKNNSSLADGMTAGFATLASQLQNQAPASNNFDTLPGMPTAPATPGMQSYNIPDKETFEKDFYTNPYDAMTKLIAPALQNQQNSLTSQMSGMNKMISKNNAYMSEANKPVLTKYADEVEAYATRLSGNDPYGDAIKQVTQNHYLEMQQDAIKAATEKALADYKAELEKAPASPPSMVGGTTLGTSEPKSIPKTRVTAAQMKKVKEATVSQFGPNAGPEYEKMMYDYMKNAGTL